MALRVEFETCNAAFGEPGDDEQFRAEVRRLLRLVSGAVATGLEGEWSLMDINGNKVGSWTLDRGCRCQPAAPEPARVLVYPCEVCHDEPASMRCDCCGTRYGKRCASRPDAGGFNCPDPGCNLYGEGAKR